jgi:hypothetical protein
MKVRMIIFFFPEALGFEPKTLLARPLPFEPLCQPSYVMGVFKIASPEQFARGWLGNGIFLIAVSCVARITGVSHVTGKNDNF